MADDGAEKPMITTPPTLCQTVMDAYSVFTSLLSMLYSAIHRDLYIHRIKTSVYVVFNDCIYF